MNTTERFNKMQDTWNRGGVVQVCTHLRVTEFYPKHRDMIKLENGSLYMQRGNAWDCIDFTGLRFGLPA